MNCPAHLFRRSPASALAIEGVFWSLERSIIEVLHRDGIFVSLKFESPYPDWRWWSCGLRRCRAKTRHRQHHPTPSPRYDPSPLSSLRHVLPPAQKQRRKPALDVDNLLQKLLPVDESSLTELLEFKRALQTHITRPTSSSASSVCISIPPVSFTLSPTNPQSRYRLCLRSLP